MDFDRKPVFDATDFVADVELNVVEDTSRITEMTPAIYANVKKVVSDLLTGEWMTLEELHFHTQFSRTLIDQAIESIDKDTQSVCRVWRRGTNDMEFYLRPPKE